MGKFYNIALSFQTATDDEVMELKNFVFKKLHDHFNWKSLDNMKIMARKEWVNGTFIDIYVTFNQKDVEHVHIDKEDRLDLSFE